MTTNANPICNLCGLSCLLTEHNHIYGTQHCECGGLINATVMGGYSSTPGNGVGALDDCTEYRFNLCEFCLDYLFTQFKIPVCVRDIHDGEEPFRSAEERVKNDEWRTMKQEFFAEKKRRDEARSNRNAQ